jgi:hypothetical protein
MLDVNTAISKIKKVLKEFIPDDAELLEEDQVKILRKPDVKRAIRCFSIFKIATDLSVSFSFLPCLFRTIRVLMS